MLIKNYNSVYNIINIFVVLLFLYEVAMYTSSVHTLLVLIQATPSLNYPFVKHINTTKVFKKFKQIFSTNDEPYEIIMCQ